MTSETERREFFDDYYLDHPPFKPSDDFSQVVIKARHLFSFDAIDPLEIDLESVAAESEARIAASLSPTQSSSNKDVSASFRVISDEDQAKLSEIIYLHDTALERALRRDGHSKSSEGGISIDIGSYWDRQRDADQEQRVAVSIYAYVIGDHRQHNFGTIDRALETVRYWYAREMAQPMRLEEHE